ncbi:hypothetical protein ATHL_03599 [Anaerolinea thermolimosa]|uniref:ATP-binding protein n=1 Tax=Anaerolinea thermolimosa TaxID=229919 RepID=A0A7U9KMQ2_9CHLR|nr:hypothetical protein [Anaerolinea thermolimosa]GAP08692.1 hypothetical protein ATHL_03599 [Anaerolinea thermolimosa]
MPESLLSEFIRIRSNRLRAVRIEDDLPNAHLLEGYTLTAQALNALERIVDGFVNHARAWTLTGPYGSGKSFFGLFLAHLLDQRRHGHAAAWEIISRTSPLIAEQLQKTLGERGSLLTVAVTGARTTLQECLARGFLQVLEAENFPNDLKQTLESVSHGDSRTFLNWVKTFVSQTAQFREKTSGVLILFDEMGKALEHAASHPQENDVYLLQELAEFASRSNSHLLVFLGILHQSFEGYAALLDRATQREWAKVQGRFEDIPYQEPPLQQIRLLANAFEDPLITLT